MNMMFYMRKIRYTRFFTAMALPLLVAGCGTYRHGSNVTVSPISNLVPDSASAVHVDVDFNIPGNEFTRRSRLVIIPQLLQHDSLVRECRAVVLDAPIYAKKQERRKVLSGYTDSFEQYARKVNNRKDMTVPYSETVSVPADIEGGRIVAVLTTDGCGECSAIDTVDVAYIANIPALIEPKESIKLNWIEPEFVIKPKIMKGKGEALLQFVINRYDINLELGNNRQEMNEMLSVLKNIVTDSLATLNSLSIYGMASADGPYTFNTALARNRANSAMGWLVDKLGLADSMKEDIAVGSRPEGWMPVLEAMRADAHKDTTKVKDILDRYNAENDDVAERYIRQLACWPDIRARYLQKDRKVEYEYTYTIRSFTTDKELLDMYEVRPDAFNEDELLRVSTLKQTHEEKKEVYRTILHYFPQSHVAANNLAVLLLKEGNDAEAEKVLDSLDEFTPEVVNTKAAVYVYRHDYEKAVELLETNVELPQAKYNLGLLMASMRNLDKAYSLMREYKDTNAAVVALSVNRNREAREIMAACNDTTPRAEYVRAIVFARENDAEAMMTHLGKAVTEERFRTRAAGEADFVPFRTREDFMNLIEGGANE